MTSNRCFDGFPRDSDYPHVEADLTYRLDAVARGPFDLPPNDLAYMLGKRLPTRSTRRPGETMRRLSAAWLTAALDAAGVDLDDGDRVVIGVLAEDCATSVQVVAGWIARARWPEMEVRPTRHVSGIDSDESAASLAD